MGFSFGMAGVSQKSGRISTHGPNQHSGVAHPSNTLAARNEERPVYICRSKIPAFWITASSASVVSAPISEDSKGLIGTSLGPAHRDGSPHQFN